MDGIMNDIFTPDMFSTVALTAAINEQPFLPGRIGELKIFAEAGVPTTSIVVEKQAGALSLVPNVPRGGPGATSKDDKRSGIPIILPHLKESDSLYADSVQGVRAFGQTSQLKTIQNARDEKLVKLARNLDFTLEYHRLGAIQGKVLDADGVTVLLDAFTAFGVGEPAEIAFDLTAASPASGAVRRKCAGVVRAIAAALGAQPFTGVYALCGDTFFDDLIANKEVRETYLNQQEAKELRGGYVYDSVTYGGITFENYRGYGAVAVHTDKCRFVPLGVPDLFITRFGPADYMDTVNTTGLPRYAQAEPLKMNRGLELEAQSNPISLCTRPLVLQRGKRGA